MSRSPRFASPPALAAWLLRVCLARRHGSLLGDLHEEFEDHVVAYGYGRAALLYWTHALHLLLMLSSHAVFWQTVMLKNYLLITVRTLWKNKGFSAINIFGLALSMALCLLIILLIADQRSTDQFHPNKDRIHRVITDLKLRSGSTWFATSPAPLADILASTYPGIEATLSMSRLRTLGTAEERSFPIRGIYAEDTFFDFFDFELRTGQREQALTQPNTVLVSEATAHKFFREKDPVGQTITLGEEGEFVITGVFAPTERRTHLEFEAVASYTTLETQNRIAERWQNNIFSFYTYLMLEEGTSIEEIAAHFPAVVAQQFEGGDNFLNGFTTQPLTGIKMGRELSNRLSSGIPPMMIYFLGGLGVLIMLTACFNYVNLSVARSLQRAKEVGVRKTFGAQRAQVIRQFLSESVVIAVCALVVGVALLVVLIPNFNTLAFVQDIGMHVSIDMIDYRLVLVFLLFSLGIGLLAGLYPAFVLSAFKPVRVLRGLAAPRGFSGKLLRKALLVAQLSLSLLFILSTLLFLQQSKVVLSADYGFDREHILNVSLHDIPYATFRAEALRQPGVVEVSATSLIPATGDQHRLGVRLPDQDQAISSAVFSVDEHFLQNLRIDLAAGRAFSSDFVTDTEQALIVNEKAIQRWDLGTSAEAIGTMVQVIINGEESPMQIVGVVKDFHFRDLDAPIEPLMLRLQPDGVQYANLRIQPLAATDVIESMKAVWDELPTTYPFEYGFYDDQIEERYTYLQDTASIIGITASFAIFIACLGLLGMASFSTQARLREVGIRKVLGASTNHLVFLLSREFVLLVGVAICVAVPLAWFLNDLWLQTFAVRTSLGVGILGVGVGALALLAVLTIGSQTLKAAITNPVETLRAE